MKPTVISILVLLFFINLCSAEQFDFSFNNVETLEQEINVNIINHDFSNKNDIKIYVHNSTDEKIARSEIISKTFNSGSWKDSWNYVSSVFPEKEEFKIKLESYSENSHICVKIRKTNSSYIIELCKLLQLNIQNIESNKNEYDSFYSTKLNLIRTIFAISTFLLILLVIILVALDS